MPQFRRSFKVSPLGMHVYSRLSQASTDGAHANQSSRRAEKPGEAPGRPLSVASIGYKCLKEKELQGWPERQGSADPQ